MRIAVLGSGMVGRSMAGGLAGLGHEVTLGTRDAAVTAGRQEMAAWQREHPAVRLAGFAEAADGADLLVNASNGAVSAEVLRLAGAERCEGTVLLDIANPLDFSQGMPPTLFVKDTDSLAEQLQRAFPGLRVVKSLNTMTADLMVNPSRLADGDFTTFVSGDDAEAKSLVTALLHDLGHRDVLDLGDLASARGTEMMMPVWLRLFGALGTPYVTYKVVR